MSRGNPTPTRKPIVMRINAGTTVYIGGEVKVELRGAHKNSAELHVYAPNSMDVDRERNFKPDWIIPNNDGPSVGAPEPSAK